MFRPRTVRVSLVLALTLAVTAGQVGLAATAWTTVVKDPTGIELRLALGPGGIHHITTSDAVGPGGTYAVDRGNRWTITNLQGKPTGLDLDPAGNVFILGFVADPSEPHGPRLYVHDDTDGSFGWEAVPGSQRATQSALAVDASGTVHVAWTNGYWNLSYATRTAGVWSSVRNVTGGIPEAHAMDIAFDGSGTAHVLMSGALEYGLAGPVGCDTPNSYLCTVDVAMTDPAAVTGAAVLDVYSLDATTGSDGSIHAVYGTNYLLGHLTNASGGWASDVIAVGNISEGSITSGPNGLVAFYAAGDNSGVRRADLIGSTWAVSTVSTVGSTAFGEVDASDDAHVAYSKSYNHADGGYLPATYLVAPDRVSPIVGSPVARATPGKPIGSTISTTVSWSATDALSGVARYQLQQSTSGGAWSTVSSTLTARSTARSLVPGRAYAFRVRGTDRAGNTGGFAAGPTIKLGAYQQTSSLLTYGGTWRTASSGSFFGGSARYATSSSAYAKVSTTARGFAWISTYGPNRGAVKIYVDGIWITTVDLRRSTTSYRMVVWSIGWSARGTHTLMIKPVGTSGRPRVDLDGFVLIR